MKTKKKVKAQTGCGSDGCRLISIIPFGGTRRVRCDRKRNFQTAVR